MIRSLVKIRVNILIIKYQPNLSHQSSIRLHFWRKIENFMENMKKWKYLIFIHFDPKIIKVIYKKLIETINVCKAHPGSPCWDNKKHLDVFSPFLKGKDTILLNSYAHPHIMSNHHTKYQVILKEHWWRYIEYISYSKLRKNQIYCTKNSTWLHCWRKTEIFFLENLKIRKYLFFCKNLR